MRALLQTIVLVNFFASIQSQYDSSIVNCPKYTGPKNGELICNHPTGRFCTVSCKAGFTPQFVPAKAYLCNTQIGHWVTFPEQLPLPWPDCVPRTNLRLPILQDKQQSSLNLQNKNSGESDQSSLLGSALNIIKSFRKFANLQNSNSYQMRSDQTGIVNSALGRANSIKPLYSGSAKNGLADLQRSSINGVPNYDYLNTNAGVGTMKNSIHKTPILSFSDSQDNPGTSITETNGKPDYSYFFPNADIFSSSALQKSSIKPEIGKLNQPNQISASQNVGQSKPDYSFFYPKQTQTMRSSTEVAKKPDYSYFYKQASMQALSPLSTQPTASNIENLRFNKEIPIDNGVTSTGFVNVRQQGLQNQSLITKSSTPENKALSWSKNKSIYVDGITLDMPSYNFVAGKFGHDDATVTSQKRKFSNSTSNTTETSRFAKRIDSNEDKLKSNLKKVNKPDTQENMNKTKENSTLLSQGNSLNQNIGNQTIKSHSQNLTQHDIHKNETQTLSKHVNNKTNTSQKDTSAEQIDLGKTAGSSRNSTFAYHVIEERHDNRTNKNNIDMLDVKSTRNEYDVENITIATTKTDIPPNANNTASANVTKSDQISDNLHRSKGPTANQTALFEKINNAKESKQLKNQTSEINGQSKDDITIHIQIKHAVNKKSSQIASSLGDNIEVNGSEAEELIKKLIVTGDKNNTTTDDHPNVKSSASPKSADASTEKADARTLDLQRLHSLRQKEINNVVEKYFKDVKLHSLNAAYHSMPPIPVFSSKDLRLLREMVEDRKNTKRSGFVGKHNSLWEKMLELSADRKHNTKSKNILTSPKTLAERDSKVAKVILNKVNDIKGFSDFLKKTNPLISMVKVKEKQNGISLGSTAVNARKGGNHKLGSRRQYVWNGATFVPMEDRSAPSSYLNSDQGLSVSAGYKWNGVSFVEKHDTTASTAPTRSQTTQSSGYPTYYYYPSGTGSFSRGDITSQDVNNVLNIWNNGGTPPRDYPTAANRDAVSGTKFPTSGGRFYVAATSKNTPTADIYEKNSNNEVLYFWNGESYQPILKTDILPPSTIKYTSTFNGFLLTPESRQLLPTESMSDSNAFFSNNVYQPQVLNSYSEQGVPPLTRDDVSQKQSPSASPGQSNTKSKPTNDARNLESNIEKIFQAHYPANERPTPSSKPQSSTPTPSAAPQQPQQQSVEQESPQLNYPPQPTSSTPPPPAALATQAAPLQSQQKSLESAYNTLLTTEAPNPYLPTSNQQTTMNPYLPPQQPTEVQQNHMINREKLSKHKENPFQEDVEDLETVIMNDLSIKQEIDALARLFTSEEDSKEEYSDKPETGQRSFESQQIFDGQQYEKHNNLIDKLTKAQDGERANILSADIRNLKAKQAEIFGILKSVSKESRRGNPKELAAKLTNAYKATLSPLYNPRRKSPVPGPVQSSEVSPLYSQGSPSYSKESPLHPQSSPAYFPQRVQSVVEPRNMAIEKPKLNKDQIKELLTLTRMAQLTAIKKHGVIFPTLKTEKKFHDKVHQLLAKPHVRMLIRYLVHSKKSRDLLRYLRKSYSDALGRTHEAGKRHEIADKYNKAIKRLLELWTKRVLQSGASKVARKPPKRSGHYSDGDRNLPPFLKG